MTNRFQVLISLTVVAVFGVARLVAAEPTAFEQRVAEANRLLDQGKLQEALVAVKAAAALDTNRFEAPFLAAVIFLELKAPEPARAALNSAVTLAPANQRPKLDALRQALAALEPPQARAATVATPTNAPPQLTAAARRQYDTLALIIEEADKATLAEERKKLLREFMEKSEPFLKENPEQMPIWTLRAVAAIELNDAKQAMQAGAELVRLGAERSDAPGLRKVMATLDRKGWLKTPQQMAEEEREARLRAEHEQQRQLAAEAEDRRKREATNRLLAEKTPRFEALKQQLNGTYKPVKGGSHKYLFKPDGTVTFLFKDAILDPYATECYGQIVGSDPLQSKLVIRFTGTKRSPVGEGKTFNHSITLHDDGTFTDGWSNDHSLYKKK